MNFPLRFKRLPLAVVSSLIVFGLPLFWMRFCLTAQNLVEVEILSDSGVRVELTNPDSESDPIPLDGLWVGNVTLKGDDAGVAKRFRFTHVFTRRFDPATCAFKFTSDKPDRSILVRAVRFRSHGYFSMSIPIGKGTPLYAFSEVNAELSAEGAVINVPADGVIMSPTSSFRKRWKFVPDFARWTGHDRISLSLILCFAIACAFFAAPPSVYGDKWLFSLRTLLPMFLVAFSAAFFFTVVLPVSSFLANRNAFRFSTGALLACQSWRFVIVLAAILFAFGATWRVLGWIPVLVLQGFLVYEYLEVGIFSADFPSLAGSTDFFTNISRQGGDFAILVAILAVFVLCGKWIRPVLHWISLALLVMICASLADTRVVDSAADEDLQDPCVRPCSVVMDKAVFSSEKNVIFFVLDAIDVKVADAVLSANPQWREALPGFIAFTNNVGMYSHTSYGVPGILTGKYCPVPKMTIGYGSSAIGPDAFFRPYADAGFPVFTLQSGLGLGWSNYGIRKPENDFSSNSENSLTGGEPSSGHEDVLRERMDAQMAWTVEELSLFRALPFFEKAKCLTRFRSAWDRGMALTPPEGVLFEALRKAPVVDAPCTLHFYHSKGGHIPFVRDRNGISWKGPDNLDGYFEQCWYAIGETVSFLQHLKEIGVYDNSLIVLLADHGLTYEHFRDVERNTHPFLWVKPPHSSAALARSGIPTSHSKVHLLARKSFSDELSADDVLEMLSQPEGRVSWTLERRIFYDPHYYDSDGNPVSDPH